MVIEKGNVWHGSGNGSGVRNDSGAVAKNSKERLVDDVTNVVESGRERMICYISVLWSPLADGR